MKSFTAVVALLVAFLATVHAHMGLLYPPPRGGIHSNQYNGRFHAFIGFKDSKWTNRFPCGGFAAGPTTNLKAGQIVPVRFFASGLSASQIKTQPKKPSSGKEINQARHGGGTCEFSLSYDGGKTYYRIGRYTKTCPDAYFTWPVRIPRNAPSCTTRGRCLFVWSWTANILPQYYHNCADIKLAGKAGGSLPKIGIQIVDFSGRKTGVTAPGDGKKTSSTGPSKAEIAANTK